MVATVAVARAPSWLDAQGISCRGDRPHSPHPRPPAGAPALLYMTLLVSDLVFGVRRQDLNLQFMEEYRFRAGVRPGAEPAAQPIPG